MDRCLASRTSPNPVIVQSLMTGVHELPFAGRIARISQHDDSTSNVTRGHYIGRQS